MTMKKIFVLFIAINVGTLGYAQESKRNDSQLMQKSGHGNPQQKSGNLTWRIVDINHQIDSLKNEIHEEYQKYSNQKLYTDEKFRNTDFAELETEKEVLRTRIIELNHDIDSRKKECQSVDRIWEYYENGNIDTLFAHADTLSLQIHKKIFGKGYPKVMDDIQTLLECADLLTKEYKEGQNSFGLQNLRGVQQCETKEYLDGLLSVQKDITDEVNSWIRDEEHTLYSMVMFRNYLYNNYGISLDVDFPYLFGKVIEKVEQPTTKE